MPEDNQKPVASNNAPSMPAEGCVPALQAFLNAFVHLDWEPFRQSFADDATVFFPPTAQFPPRADGRAAIETVFRLVFDNARSQRSEPPYLIIQPENVSIQPLRDAAIVTFHLEAPDAFGRRTLVFEKRAEQWLIVHLHASNLERL